MLSFDEFQDALEDVPVSNCLEPPFAEDHRSADMLTTDVLSKSAARSGLWSNSRESNPGLTDGNRKFLQTYHSRYVTLRFQYVVI